MIKETETILAIKMRKMLYLGHIKRGDKYELLQLTIQGKISGRISEGYHTWKCGLT